MNFVVSTVFMVSCHVSHQATVLLKDAMSLNLPIAGAKHFTHYTRLKLYQNCTM